MDAVKLAGYTGNVVVGTDAAPSEFCTKDDKEFKCDLNKFVKYTKKETLDSVEDSHDEEDYESWAAFNKQLGDKIQIVDGDLLVTNPTRIQKAIEEKSCTRCCSPDRQPERSNLAVGLSTGQIKTDTPPQRAASVYLISCIVCMCDIILVCAQTFTHWIVD